MSEILAESDWLGLPHIYYNKKTGAFGENIHEVIDYGNMTFNLPALKDYLDFGYSVFGKTPVEDVFFLRANERLQRNSYGLLEVVKLPGKDIGICDGSSETEVIEWMLNWSSEYLKRNTATSILVPVSGGFDSRLLLWALRQNKSSDCKVFARTYGISRCQEDSFEVEYAREVAEILGIPWESVPLCNFHKFIPNWLELFGVSTHAHGMYHWEFYSRIAEQAEPQAMISGIVGDVWAGGVMVDEPATPLDLLSLGYTHGVRADSVQAGIMAGTNLIQEFEEQRDVLRDPKMRLIYLVRTKLILLSYLLRVPEKIGFKADTPFLSFDLVKRMLNLPDERRKNRRWQRDFFEREGLNIESCGKKTVRENSLDFDQLVYCPLPPLDSFLLREVISPVYVDWINRNISRIGKLGVFRYRLTKKRYIGRILREFGFSDNTLNAYYAYLTIVPLQDAICRRNRAVKNVQRIVE